MWGVATYFWGSATPLPQGNGALTLLNFGDCFLFMHTPFDAELPNVDQHVGTERACYGRTLSDASMLYFADVFFLIFFNARLSWRNG